MVNVFLPANGVPMDSVMASVLCCCEFCRQWQGLQLPLGILPSNDLVVAANLQQKLTVQ